MKYLRIGDKLLNPAAIGSVRLPAYDGADLTIFGPEGEEAMTLRGNEARALAAWLMADSIDVVAIVDAQAASKVKE